MSSLQHFLDRLQVRYNRAEFLESDPIEFAHRYRDPWDREVVAILAAVLAYGNVKQIRRSVQDALDRMLRTASSPASFVREMDSPAATRAFEGFVHRFNVGSDLVTLFQLISKSWRLHGSVGAHFLQGLDPSAPDFGQALDRFMSDWKAWSGKPRGSSFHYLLTAPGDGSCCKRWCMLLRWMGRSDEVDLGLWAQGSPLEKTFPKGRFLRPDQLVLPLDTHTGRISQYLGLTQRKSMDWKAALEVTARLRECHPSDPTRYDFAMARLGILDLCQRAYRQEVCEECELLTVCKFAQRNLTRRK